MCQGIRAERCHRCLAHPFDAVECREHVQYLAFVPDSVFVPAPCFCSQLFRSGRFFVLLCLFVSSCHEFAPTANAQSDF